jgi:hypothetical protein
MPTRFSSSMRRSHARLDPSRMERGARHGTSSSNHRAMALLSGVLLVQWMPSLPPHWCLGILLLGARCWRGVCRAGAGLRAYCLASPGPRGAVGWRWMRGCRARWRAGRRGGRRGQRSAAVRSDASRFTLAGGTGHPGWKARCTAWSHQRVLVRRCAVGAAVYALAVVAAPEAAARLAQSGRRGQRAFGAGTWHQRHRLCARTTPAMHSWAGAAGASMACAMRLPAASRARA